MTAAKVCPREPTAAMLSKAQCLYVPTDCKTQAALDHGRAEIWRAMYDAAPSEPTQTTIAATVDADALISSAAIRDTWRYIWRAMYDAAPTVSAEPARELLLSWLDAYGNRSELSERTRAYLAAQDQPQAAPPCAAHGPALDRHARCTCPIAPKCPNCGEQKVYRKTAEHSLPIKACRACGEEWEDDETFAARERLRTIATPAAEPDAERRIRELADKVCGTICAPSIHDALRTFGAEQRAAERALWEQDAKRYREFRQAVYVDHDESFDAYDEDGMDAELDRRIAIKSRHG